MIEAIDSSTFKLVMTAAENARAAYLNNFWATFGFLLAANGWFVKFTATDKYSQQKKKFFSGIIVALAVVHACVLFYTYNSSVKLHAILSGMKFRLSAEAQTVVLYEYVVPELWLLVNIGLNGALFALLIWQIQHVDKQAES
ncbi:MAG: hypothetical protein OEZ39_07205 [Gammaproteobacteria bacterium]|nr:hypothetical protein [Gammaproteobacteria bacterium]MDH5651645.1 hypothetical protein [Gammaproteobacteria bacterium]